MKITDCRIGEKIPLSELKVGGVFFGMKGEHWKGVSSIKGFVGIQVFFGWMAALQEALTKYVLVARLCDGYGIALLEETKIIPVDAELILTPFSGE